MSILYFDGLCEPHNPGGHCCYGYVLYVEHKTYKGQGYIGRGTNNEAEYAGVIEGLRKAIDLGVKTLIVRGDSMLVINQLSGEWRVKSPNLMPFYNEATALISMFDLIIYEWIPRQKNGIADKLSRKAYSGLTAAIAVGKAGSEVVV